MLCDNCKGEGHIIIPGEHLGHGRYDDDKQETCRVCEGSGLVTVTRNTVVTVVPKYPRP